MRARRRGLLVPTLPATAAGAVVVLALTHAAIAQTDDELREQYVIGYYPSDNRNDGAWHEVRVRLRGNVRVRARDGYYDDLLAP